MTTMVDYDDRAGDLHECERPLAKLEPVSDLASSRRALLLRDLSFAGALLERDADAAALLLDGLVQRIGAEWFLAQGAPAPRFERLLGELEQKAHPVAWRLRLALRAPDARARYLHARACLQAICNE
jgi:hypothetical protein